LYYFYRFIVLEASTLDFTEASNWASPVLFLYPVKTSKTIIIALIY